MKYLSLGLCLLLFSCGKKISNDNHSIEYKGDYSKYKGIDTLSTFLVDRYAIDLDYDSKIDTIVLENHEDLRGDPQTFTIMKVQLGTNKEYVFKNIQGGQLDQKAKLRLPNRIKSDKLYIPETREKSSLIFIWDYQYPDCTAGLAIYLIDSKDITEKRNQNFYVSEVSNSTYKGKVAVIGKPDCEEETASDTIFVSL
ncbi:hypothetical protein [Rufibacter roseus]|uniref:Lipoprotein n=1 Tax=Rufibacter roseus TaxID=1567108 RepID=A0ABW2DIP2_9BACT|nr:hypothetical protein [Rufibacter roseus]